MRVNIDRLLWLAAAIVLTASSAIAMYDVYTHRARLPYGYNTVLLVTSALAWDRYLRDQQ